MQWSVLRRRHACGTGWVTATLRGGVQPADELMKEEEEVGGPDSSDSSDSE